MSSDSTVLIPLTQGQYAIVDKEDADFVNQWKWIAHYSRNKWYAVRTSRENNVQTGYKMHREILSRKIGRPLSKDEQCDHINRNGLDNRRENLRIASPSQNSQNRKPHSNNTSGYPGVHFNKGRGKRWRAAITANRKRIHVGYFDTPEEASLAREEKAKELFGEFYPRGVKP